MKIGLMSIFCIFLLSGAIKPYIINSSKKKNCELFIKVNSKKILIIIDIFGTIHTKIYFPTGMILSLVYANFVI